MKNLIFNIVFFVTMFQLGSTAVLMWFFEDRVMEFSTDQAGMDAYGRFIEEFGPSVGPTFRKQMALMHYMEAVAAGLIVVGMFLFGNFRIGHLFAAIGCAAIAIVSQTVVDTFLSYPQITGNEAMVEQAPQGIMIFAGMGVANLLSFLLSDKPFFPSPQDCDKEDTKKQE